MDSLHTGKIAAGMEVPFVLKFTPTDDADFAYNLVCTTDREKFIVPIRVISSRGMHVRAWMCVFVCCVRVL